MWRCLWLHSLCPWNPSVPIHPSQSVGAWDVFVFLSPILLDAGNFWVPLETDLQHMLVCAGFWRKWTWSRVERGKWCRLGKPNQKMLKNGPLPQWISEPQGWAWWSEKTLTASLICQLKCKVGTHRLTYFSLGQRWSSAISFLNFQLHMNVPLLFELRIQGGKWKGCVVYLGRESIIK